VPKLDRQLTDWLNHTVYPKLNHDLVFGNLPNYHAGPPKRRLLRGLPSLSS